MSLAIVWFSVWVILSNFLLGNVEGQPRDSSTVFQALENLTKAMERLEAKIELQTATLLNNLEAKAEIQTNLFNALQSKVEMQGAILSNLDAFFAKVEPNVEIQVTPSKQLVIKEERQEPIIAQPPTNPTLIALEDDDVEMPCVVHGIPLAEITWKRDNVTLESDRVVEENNGKTLRIKKVQLSDEGTYFCVAANGVPGSPVTQSVRLVVYGEAKQCSRIVESDSGSLTIKPSSTGCLWVIKLQNTTGFRLELDLLMTEPIWVIPEQTPSNSSAQYIQLSGFKNPSPEFQGKILAIVVPPGRERTTLSWTGLALDGSRVSSSTKLVKDVEGTLEWESQGEGIDNIFWVFDHKFTQELNWTLKTAFGARDHENPFESMSFSVFEITPDGNISKILRTCDDSSKGSVTLEINSQVFVLLHLRSAEATRSKLRVSWTHKENDEPLKKTVDGIVAGINGGVFVIPFNSAQTKAVPSGHMLGLTVDWNSRRIYYMKERVGIFRSNLDGSASETLVSDPSLLFGMTIEPTTGNIYYGNRTSRTIRVCNNDATKCSTVSNSSDLSNVWDFAVHRSKGLLFWSIRHQKVVRANLDGSNATVLLQRKVYGLDVDEKEDRLYWGLYPEGIESCDLNGQDIRTLQNVNGLIYDVAIDNDRVYYSNYNTKKIHGILKSGTDSTLVDQLPNYVIHMALFGKQVSNQPWNPCKKSECAHLCVLVTRWSYRCTCADHQVLNADGRTCTL